MLCETWGTFPREEQYIYSPLLGFHFFTALYMVTASLLVYIQPFGYILTGYLCSDFMNNKCLNVKKYTAFLTHANSFKIKYILT